METVCAALSDQAYSTESTASLRGFAKDLAGPDGPSLRDTLNADDEVSGALQRAWKHLGASDLVVADRDPSEALVAFSAGVAMFTRNLVAGHRTLQDKCFEVQSDIRKVLFASSSFSRMADPQFVSLNTLATQALANLVTANDELLDRFWPDLLRQEDARPLICRLLSTSEDKLLVATCVLVLNCVHSSGRRIRLLVQEKGGTAILHAMLEQLDTLLEDRESRAFEIITAVVDQIIVADLTSEAFSHLALESLPLSPAQLCILKVLDTNPLPVLSSPSHLAFLLSVHESLGNRILALKTLEPSSSSDPVVGKGKGRGVVDAEPGDAKVWQGFVLVCDMMERVIGGSHEDAGVTEDQRGGQRAWTGDEGEAVVRRCSAILIKAPSLFPSKIAPSSAMRPNPSATPPSSDPRPPSHRPRDALSHLRIGILKLLSAFCFGKDGGAGRMQDAVRESGGLGAVLELTQMDEHAAFVREHALFLVRNLLMHNPTNQQVIAEMRLERKWVLDERGQVQEMPI